MLTLAQELLTHVLSYLHPDSHAAVALVSKRFYTLVATPHAWRAAFLRHFPGHALLESKTAKVDTDAVGLEPSSDLVRLETRYFGRLTPLATWRSEYLLRTRLLRSLARGKPATPSGDIGSSGSGPMPNRKSAVLTYNSKLPWLVTNIHAVFSNGKKPAQAIQGSSHLGAATMSDPSNGRIEKWGFQDPFVAAQLAEMVPGLVPYGLGEGPAAAPNVMDVSQPYGVVSGEGFPGGRAYYRAPGELCGRYLGAESGVADTYPDMPKVPEMSDAMCSVWIAKSSAVPATTRSMCGMLTGSALGVVSAYSLGWGSGGLRYANGDMTARWVLSPGVPVISLKVDDDYNPKRASSARVWAVALNALGEVFYLTQTPTTTLNRASGDDVCKHAWLAGRSVYWHLIESTRRLARPDGPDKNAVRGAYTPRSPADSMGLSKEQLAAEAREVEKFLRYKPAHFRKFCEGWDMLRRLEVDFAADDGEGAGEGVFVIDCGLAEGRPASVRRFTRCLSEEQAGEGTREHPMATDSPPPRAASSLFAVAGHPATDQRTAEPTSPTPTPPAPRATAGLAAGSHEWCCSVFELKGHSQAVVSASGMEGSSQAVLTLAEDPLRAGPEGVTAAAAAAGAQSAGAKPTAGGEIPGRRARLMAVGTKSGAVLIWNARHVQTDSVHPLRVVQTDSPEISCLAISALYLVHGGTDGLVQAWDVLASTTDPLRTLNARPNGRVPRHMTAMNPALRDSNYLAVGAIYLDADPTVLRGVLSFGAFLRYWTFSSAGHAAGRKRRLRHSDVHGRIASRRLGGAVSGYIAAEEAELRRDEEQRAREQSWLRKRFGVGALGDLTEEEAMRYAQMMSEETYRQDEQRRTSDSAADDVGPDNTASSSETAAAEAVTPEPRLADASKHTHTTAADDGDGEFEWQIQQAIRLSLLESGVGGAGGDDDTSLRGSIPGEPECVADSGREGNGKGRRSGLPLSSPPPAAAAQTLADEDEDLALALGLSMQDQQRGSSPSPAAAAALSAGRGPGVVAQDEFPPLVGKGKGVAGW